MSTYLQELAKVLKKIELPEFSAGASGYFSKPRQYLDPALFDGDRVRPEVRESVLKTLFGFWRHCGYRNPEAWATVWLFGSGISYQWAGDRGNGDLDVLVGVHWPAFYVANPQWALSTEAMADHMDDELWSRLWPRTARTVYGGKVFEETFYVNRDAENMRDIKAYVAYDLTDDEWAIRPPDPDATAYYHSGSPQWEAVASADQDTARRIARGFTAAWEAAQADHPSRPAWTNSMSAVRRYVGQASALMAAIHGGRKAAFSVGGQGYWDFANWRWQRAKQSGVVAVMSALEEAHKAVEAAVERDLYGQQLGSATDVVTRAALMYRSVQ